MGKSHRVRLCVAGAVLLICLALAPSHSTRAMARNEGGKLTTTRIDDRQLLSPFWPMAIQDWSELIVPVAQTYGLDPDFVAAVVKAESNGMTNAVSHVGAVGLMGIMPSGPGMEWRPSTEELSNPGLNLDWGVAILSEILSDAGGDLSAALAAYSGGWDHVNRSVPRAYAAGVLDDYGRAIAARSGVAPEIGARWTVAIEIRRGYIPGDAPLLILGDQPVSGVYTYGEHVVYDALDEEGNSFYVKGYAVPLALTVPEHEANVGSGSSNALEPELDRRVREEAVRNSHSNPQVLLACLPSLGRLRGRASTRWFAPSFCPDWHR